MSRRARTDNASAAFWDGVADRYDAEIFNTLAAEVKGTLRKTIVRFAKGAQVAADFGCGVGRFVPLLSKLAAQVHAVDFSQESIDIAARDYAALTNVSFRRANLAQGAPRICRADVALSVNVLVMPDREKRRAILKNTWRNIRSGGHLILVVPSLEAVLYSYQRLAEWHERDGEAAKTAIRRVEREATAELSSIVQGHVVIQAIPTKHFLREEALLMLAGCGFEPVADSRVEYAWHEDYDDPPNWLGAPFPWDWLFVALRK